MKVVLLSCFLLIASTASAQQPPAGIPKPAAAIATPSAAEMAALLRAQTDAITALSKKTAELEERIDKLEKRR